MSILQYIEDFTAQAGLISIITASFYTFIDLFGKDGLRPKVIILGIGVSISLFIISYISFILQINREALEQDLHYLKEL